MPSIHIQQIVFAFRCALKFPKTMQQRSPTLGSLDVSVVFDSSDLVQKIALFIAEYVFRGKILVLIIISANSSLTNIANEIISVLLWIGFTAHLVAIFKKIGKRFCRSCGALVCRIMPPLFQNVVFGIDIKGV